MMRAVSAAAYQGDVAVRSSDRQQPNRGFDHYVRVQMPSSHWTENVSKRLNQLAALPQGWDGYFASPVPFTNAAFVAALIERLSYPGVEAPQIVPGSDGRLQIEWHSGGYDIELEVLAPHKVNASRENISTGHIDEAYLESDFSVLTGWLADLDAAKVAQSASG